MVLDWAVERTRDLPADDAYAVRFAALCHDLGKNETPPDELPSHRGHEHGGVPIIESLCKRLPGLADSTTKRLATQVAKLHLTARGMRDLRNGTLARMYDEYFRPKSFRRDLFAMAVASDVGGRLDREQEGHEVEARILADLDWVCSRCERVDAAAIRDQHTDTEAFRAALHEARAKSIGRSS